MNQPTYAPLSADAASSMFANSIDKVQRVKNFLEVICKLASQDKALSSLAIEGLCLCESIVDSLRDAYHAAGLTAEAVEGLDESEDVKKPLQMVNVGGAK